VYPGDARAIDEEWSEAAAHRQANNVDREETQRSMTIRNPALWGLCAVIILVFAYCFFAGLMTN
jgi:hypothetical protein